MNTKIIVALVIGIALVGLTGAASADPSIEFPATADIDYAMIGTYTIEELNDDMVDVYQDSGAYYYMDVEIWDCGPCSCCEIDYVEMDGDVYNWVWPTYYGVSGDFAGEMVQAGAVSSVLSESDVAGGAISTYQEVSYEGQSIEDAWTWFGMEGSTDVETPQLESGLDNCGFGETEAWANSGVLLGGTDTYATSSAYLCDTLPAPSTIVTAGMDIGTSATGTGDIGLWADGWLDAWVDCCAIDPPCP